MKKYLLLLFTLSVVGFGSLHAQGRVVSGKVISASDNSPLPGVNVVIKGTSSGAVTDIDGNYRFTTNSEDDVLVFTYVGYARQEVAVNGRSVIDVSMAPDVTQLTEVVVVGYGTQEKKEITSAVTSVGEEEFNVGNVTQASQLIQGKVSGLSIVRPGGDPNAGFSIRLRGLSTFGANSEPLVVIDGVIGASLDNVDPNDIQSIDVLKDASAAAIYGSRGSSGVIIVTTKSGKGLAGGEAMVIEVNAFGTVDQVANKIEVLSPEEFVEIGGTDFGSTTDWFDELTRTGVSYTTNISASGSFGSTNYRASINYRDNEGVAKGTGFERLNTRLGINHGMFDNRLRLNLNASINNRTQESINMDAFRYAVIYNPTAPIFDNENTDEDAGYFQRGLFDFYNPVALINQQQFDLERKNLLTSFDVKYDLLDNLLIGVLYSQDRQTGLTGNYFSKFDPLTGRGANGAARRTTWNNLTELAQATLQYNFDMSNFNATVLVGTETQSRKNEGFGVQTRNFLFDELGYNNLGAGGVRLGENTDVYSYKNEDRLNSAFGRLNLNFDNTFFGSFSLRRDAYSGFGANEKAGLFPAASIGIQLTELADLGAVNSLKARVSFGVSGNLPPSPTLALRLYGNGSRVDLDNDPLTTGDVFVSPRVMQNANPTLKWETKEEWNFGFDFALFDSRLTGSMDYYRRDIEDLLYNVQVPIGGPNPFLSGDFNTSDRTWANIADLSAGGFEFAATYNGIEIGNVQWTPSFNFTVYDKTVIERFTLGGLGFSELRLATPGSPGQNNNPIIRNKVGETIGNFYGPEFLGIDEQGNYVLSSEDPEEWGKIGNGLPDGEIGFANNFIFGNWDLSFFLRGVFGHDLYNSYRGFYENRDASSTTWNSVVTDKTDPRITDTPTFSSFYIEDASFLRLDNASIGYNLPVESDAFSRIRIYATGQNLFTITDYTGIDPEVRYRDAEIGDAFTSSLAPGIERRNTYFTSRSYSLGINISFR